MKKAKSVENKAIDNKELILAMEELEKEKGIKKEYLLESVETALVTAYKRNFDSKENVRVAMDKETGEVHLYAVKDVSEVVEDGSLQISLENAKKINPRAELGDQVNIELAPKDFGRIAAGTAKQVIVQKLREAEREVIFTEFNDRKGEIVSGIIQKADGNNFSFCFTKLLYYNLFGCSCCNSTKIFWGKLNIYLIT